MRKVSYRTLIIALLTLMIVTQTVVALRQNDVPLLYLSEYSDDDYYMVLDVETGEQTRIDRPEGFEGFRYGGQGEIPPQHQDFASPHDETVRFAVLFDYASTTHFRMYRVGADDSLAYIAPGVTYNHFFTGNGRYLYFFSATGSNSRYTLYRYDIQSGALTRLVENAYSWIGCQQGSRWCMLISQIESGDDVLETLFTINRDSGELRHVTFSRKVINRYWLETDVLLYAAVDANGGTMVRMYDIETDSHHPVKAFATDDLQFVTYSAEQQWLLVHSRKLETEFSIITDIRGEAIVHPLDIELEAPQLNARSDDWLMLGPKQSGDSYIEALYVVTDPANDPAVYALSAADFGVDNLLAVDWALNSGSSFKDIQILRVDDGDNDNEWHIYALDMASRTATRIATLNQYLWIVDSVVSEDGKWLAMSYVENNEYVVGVVPTDGSQPMQVWDVGMETYVCLLGWYSEPASPPACDLYFGMG